MKLTFYKRLKACDKLNEMKNDQNTQLVKVEEIDTGYEDEQLDYENLDELEEGTGFISENKPDIILHGKSSLSNDILSLVLYDLVKPCWKEVEVKKQKVARKRPSKSLNLCRGPGCKCGKSFVSREELQTHYLERGCFTCKECDERFPSKLTLKDHIQDVHLSLCLLDKDNGWGFSTSCTFLKLGNPFKLSGPN